MVTLLTQSLPAADMKVQFQEPFLSRALNQKGAGVIPEGVYRGFLVSALGFTVTLDPDPTTGDSVAVCDTLNASLLPNNHNVTIQHVGPITLDFTGVLSYPNVIVLEARYDLTSPTPLSGLSEVRVKVVQSVDVLPQHVILAEVTGPPPIIDVTNAERTGGPLLTPTSVVPILGTFAFAKFSTPIGSFGWGGGGLTAIPGTAVSFTLTASRAVKFTMGSGGIWKAPAGTTATVYIYVDATYAIQVVYLEGSNSGGTLVESAGCARTYIDPSGVYGPGTHTAEIAIAGAGGGVVLFGPIQMIVETGEPI